MIAMEVHSNLTARTIAFGKNVRQHGVRTTGKMFSSPSIVNIGRRFADISQHYDMSRHAKKCSQISDPASESIG